LAVDHFTHAEDAIDRLGQQHDYDLLITDVLLKGRLSGLDLIAHVRNLPESQARLPILTVTGFDEAARRIELLRAGTNDYVVKPVLPDELAVRVNNLISNKHLLDQVIRQQTRLREMAMTDQLTGCLNRRGLRDLIARQLANRRRKAQSCVDALLMLDLDLFKKLNDNHGHDAGDRVLAAVGTCLRKFLREDDMVCRMGGEEFVLYLPDCQKRQARSAADRLRRAIERLHPDGLAITASIGVTTIEPNKPEDLDQALLIADRALYRAKRRGRNRVAMQHRLNSA
ncbi:MAG: diguanylate cyclase response regulator, partial [Gammaproteobacteria bacterium HGW-Gammaproteobacteria-8]